jgi:Ser/Thr protein kinase RdoA (MazF antagonist)
MQNFQPYSQLTPSLVLDALDAVGLRGDGRLLQLNSYENRVFQVHLEQALGAAESVVVAKFYRPARWSNEQILEEHQFAAELMAEEIPVCAPLTLAVSSTAPAPQQIQDLRKTVPTGRIEDTFPGHGEEITTTLEPFCASPKIVKVELCGPTLAQIWLDENVSYRFSVTPRQAGRSPELEDPQTLEWIGRFIARMHCVAARKPFVHRRTLSVETLGRQAQNWLLGQEDLSEAASHSHHIPQEVLPSWKIAAEQALTAAQIVFDQHRDVRTLRLHGDCHVGNLLWTESGPHFVDLDDACNGPAVQDLWMLLSGDANTAQRQTQALLRGYETFMPFDDRELALMEPLRVLRMIHHSAWLAQRWSDPAFPAGFPWFGTSAYWQQQVVDLREAAASLLRKS